MGKFEYKSYVEEDRGITVHIGIGIGILVKILKNKHLTTSYEVTAGNSRLFLLLRFHVVCLVVAIA